MNPDGTGQLRLTGRNNASDPTWSPDGSEIAYVSREPEPDIYVLDPNDFGSVLRQVTFDAAYEFGPSWSPDGTRIVFERGRADGSNNDVFRADADGSGHETQLTSGHGDHSPDWQSLSRAGTRRSRSARSGARASPRATPARPTPSSRSTARTRPPSPRASTTRPLQGPRMRPPTTRRRPARSPWRPATATCRSGCARSATPPPNRTRHSRSRSTSSDVVIDRPTATATIADDDGFTVRVETLSVTEGNAGFQDVDLGVTLSHAADQPVRADLVIRSVAALFGVDYDLLSSATVVFDPGDVREVVTFRIYGDVDVEGDQKIEILPIAQLVTDANSLDGGIWIRDDDLATLSIDDVTVTEGASPGIATFTVTRSNVADDVIGPLRRLRLRRRERAGPVTTTSRTRACSRSRPARPRRRSRSRSSAMRWTSPTRRSACGSRRRSTRPSPTTPVSARSPTTTIRRPSRSPTRRSPRVTRERRRWPFKVDLSAPSGRTDHGQLRHGATAAPRRRTTMPRPRTR